LNDNKLDVIIIGAGPAGCSAGYQLTKQNKSILIIEKLKLTGGLSRTIQRNGANYDIGPHRFFTKSERVSNLWKEIKNEKLIEVKRLTRIMYENKLFSYPLQPINALFGLGLLKSSQAILSFLKSQANQILYYRNAVSFEDWIVDQFGYFLYSTFFKTYTEKIWGIKCKNISPEWANQRIKNLNLIKAIINSFTKNKSEKVKTLIGQFLYPDDGAGSMYNSMCDYIVDKGNGVQYKKEVIKIYHNSNYSITGIDVLNENNQIESLSAENYISSMPITEFILRMEPPPHENILSAARSLLYRTHISVNFLVEGNPFPDNWIYVHNPDVCLGRVANYNNFSSKMSKNKNLSPLTFEYFTFRGDEIESLQDKKIIELALCEGRKIGLLNDKSPKDAFVVRNYNAYCVIKRGYEKHCSVLRTFLNKFTNFQTIGRAGMFKYNNQDHSIMTGLLAADNILGTQNNIWNVNVDAEYHESGTAPDLCEEDHVISLKPNN